MGGWNKNCFKNCLICWKEKSPVFSFGKIQNLETEICQDWVYQICQFRLDCSDKNDSTRKPALKKALSWTILYNRHYMYFSLNGSARSFFQRWFEPVWKGHKVEKNVFKSIQNYILMPNKVLQKPNCSV